jgi:hypothetical protein
MCAARHDVGDRRFIVLIARSVAVKELMQCLNAFGHCANGLQTD